VGYTVNSASNIGFGLGAPWDDAAGHGLSAVARPLQMLMSAPSLLYLGTLTIMLFRPPDLDFYCLDRIAFGLLVVVVGLRTVMLREAWWPGSRIALPMGAILVLVLTGLLMKPFEVQLWSVAIAKFFVPYTMFYLGGLVFRDDHSLKQLEMFALMVLGYLIYLALASLAHLDVLVFPKFILDPGLGLNATRARGPFLQPVANGAALNILGLIALDAYGRGRLHGLSAILLIVGLPLAILATLTRSVWLGFGLTTVLLFRWTASRRVRRVCWAFLFSGAVALLLVAAGKASEEADGRLTDGETVNFRLAAYEAGWTMFEERPFLGWGASRVQTELADRIEGFRGEVFVVHNTYLEILLEHGLLGFALYVWLAISLMHVGRYAGASERYPANKAFLRGIRGRTLWLFLLSVYFINAMFVVMNYQFVNGLLFTIGGVLAYQDRALRNRRHREALLEARCET
jgi:O-antigen ligase